MATTNLITALGAADIDTKELTANLVAAVKEPRQQLIDKDKNRADVAISNLALLKNGLSALSTAASNIAKKSKLTTALVTSSNAAVVNATASGSTALNSATYAISVTALAEPERQQASFPEDWTATETMAIDLSSVPGAADDAPLIEIAKGDTPADISDAINFWLKTYAARSGVSVSRINANHDIEAGNDAPPGVQSIAIIIEGPTGAANEFNVDFFKPKDGVTSPRLSNRSDDWLPFNNDDLSAIAANQVSVFQRKNSPKDAEFTLNGLSVKRASNVVNDVIDGMSIELRSLSESPISITTKPDSASIIANVKEFVDTYNIISDFLKKATGPKVEGDDVSGSLKNDSTAKTILQNLRRAVTSELTTAQANTVGSIRNLNSLGITFNKIGVLEFDETIFAKAFESKPEDVITALGNNTTGPYLGTTEVKTGLVGYIANLSYKMASTTGVVSSITKSYEEMLIRVGKKQTDLDRYIERITAQYDDQFAALNSALAAFKNTSSQLEKALNLNRNEN
jgi:flagellar hook-associated protein 2